jgi:hypothetical protein
MTPKCPHCQHTLTRGQIARLLASLSAGRPKNFSEAERRRRRLRMQAINARRGLAGLTTGMQHRNLTHQNFTAAAIDDVIDRGGREPWARLLDSVDRSREIRERVLRVCAAHLADPRAQRYHFWNRYAAKTQAAS